MADRAELLSRAREPSLLQRRIAGNVTGVDLTAWIFERLSIAPDSRVLELCAGTGAQSLRFLSELTDGELVCTDISGEALKAARAQASPAQLLRLRTIVSDIDALGEASQREGADHSGFDLVFCAYGLYYSTDPQALLSSVKAWLNPGGEDHNRGAVRTQ